MFDLLMSMKPDHNEQSSGIAAFPVRGHDRQASGHARRSLSEPTIRIKRWSQGDTEDEIIDGSVCVSSALPNYYASASRMP